MTNNQTLRQQLKSMTRGAYDIQKLRIQMGNRIAANFRSKLGIKPGEKEEEAEEDVKGTLELLRASYKKITDGIKAFPRQSTFKGDELISNYTELCLVAEYCDLETSEDKHFRRLEAVLQDFPIYIEFLEKVRGCGPAMSAVIISEFDIHKAEYPSSLWMYSGLDVAPDGKGRSKKKEHLVKVKYKDAEGVEQEKDGITFNPFLKTKLVGVLGSCFIKLGGKYREIYDFYKNRLENHPEHIKKTKGHRHNMAVRYMIKRFLVDLYSEWRKLEGLPVALEYSEAKLGMHHKKAA